MTPNIHKAAVNASCAIAVGILLDQVRALRVADVLRGAGARQAEKVERHAQDVLNTLPIIKSARGVKRIKHVCDVCQGGFRDQYPGMKDTAVMGALVAIFASHASICELIRAHRLRTQSWRWLDQTSTRLMAMLLEDMPEEEERLWAASVPVLETLMEVAA